ncbi:MAG: glycine dehydrogenase subunit 2 [Candidatus Thorarchaeota archaeon]|nr:glycine dehydrogenase subunit 2 [Candidatus Thorarchaeota archaeon]
MDDLDSRFRQAKWMEPLLFEQSVEGKISHKYPKIRDGIRKEIGSIDLVIPREMQRSTPPILPELSELQVVRHFTRLSQMNFSVTSGTYPLGSCTMKYNPIISEWAAALPGFSWLHPLQDVSNCQGALELMWELQRWLAEITGMDAVTLQPAAGAQGEYTGVTIIREYHKCITHECEQRDEILIPDAAHGTNPASAAMAGYKVVVLPSSNEGLVDLDALRASAGPKTAGLMLTNPNTIGVFEKDIDQIAGIVHDAGGLLYYDGANLNAIMGITRPGDMGFDVVHMNLHKSFSTPHGGGGPGAGAVGVKKHLEKFLPVPTIIKDDDGAFKWMYDRPRSIGKIHGFYGNFGVLVKAYSYIYSLGKQGISSVAENAVLNANYVAYHVRKIKGFTLPYSQDAPRMHECVISAEQLHDETGVSTMHVAKRLLDFGIHSPTVYFPLIVPEALMIEPTETESKEELDLFIAAMEQISKEAYESPSIVMEAPHSTALRKLDEYTAAHPKTLTLSWRMFKKREDERQMQ